MVTYEIVYDFTDAFGNESLNLTELFEGDRSSLQNHIEEMKKSGCSNIVTARARE